MRQITKNQLHLFNLLQFPNVLPLQSAVKAKLVELGTGGAAGYIDDELPDYVMIMVANKRSKDQMITDLNLFLGTQTELFVVWLHEVLAKLQEVTLPAANGKWIFIYFQMVNLFG